jgi:hypothetical protein
MLPPFYGGCTHTSPVFCIYTHFRCTMAWRMPKLFVPRPHFVVFVSQFSLGSLASSHISALSQDFGIWSAWLDLICGGATQGRSSERRHSPQSGQCFPQGTSSTTISCRAFSLSSSSNIVDIETPAFRNMILWIPSLKSGDFNTLSSSC